MSGTFSYFQVMAVSVLGLIAVYYQLLPMQMEAGSAPQPDLLLVLIMAWTIRRPDTIPLILAAALFLMADLTLDRPAGLWALISLLAYEFLRGQRPAIIGRPFPVEWATVAIVLAVAMIVQELILSLTLVPTADASQLVRLYVVTIVAYPVMAALLHYVFRVRAPKPKDESYRLGRVR